MTRRSNYLPTINQEQARRQGKPVSNHNHNLIRQMIGNKNKVIESTKAMYPVKLKAKPKGTGRLTKRGGASEWVLAVKVVRYLVFLLGFFFLKYLGIKIIF